MNNTPRKGGDVSHIIEGPANRRAAAAPRKRLTAEAAVVMLACLGQFLVVLDASVVNVALPSISNDLHFSVTGLSWVTNAYAATTAGLLMIGGRAVDIFGRKPIFIYGVAVFTVGSLLCGVAQSSEMLVVCRFVQGSGAAAIGPASLAILMTSFPEGQRRAKALGTWSAVGAAGGAVGNLVGGVLTDTLSWRWVFLINLPVGAFVLLLTLRYLDWGKESAGRRLNLSGVITITLGLSLIDFGVIQAADHSWGSLRTMLPIVAGILSLAGFLVLQVKSSQDPLIPVRVLKSIPVTTANFAMFATGAAFFSMWYFVSLYLQDVRHYTPLETGLAFLPQTVTVVLFARVLTPKLLHRTSPRYVVMLGASLSVIGFLAQSRMGLSGSYLMTVAVPGIFVTAGMGLLFTPLATVATGGAARADAGVVSGLINTSRQVGGSIGLATMVTVAAFRSRSVRGDDISGQSAEQVLSAGYSWVFLAAAVLIVIGVLPLLLTAAGKPD
ncbi:MFS transporter [Jatrophihabitans lederbergiae]|uniref:MFS transporter n=1 Tax=Jatrophihabitans lederbergiae TaxID=3075547 RepID=A0ABU2JI91_9ACTN|nr:MFS transporter [Jatrophihabitans sp. DSM 44399]MDT0264214.1 MFS transporter [Jatrophihabitans sp. DSM 44399]